MWQIPLPPCFVGKTFACVLESLLEMEEPLLTVGVFRHPPQNIFKRSHENHREEGKGRRRQNSNSHFVMDRSLSSWPSENSGLHTPGVDTDVWDNSSKAKNMSAAIACPDRDFKVLEDDVLFVFGNKSSFLRRCE